MRTLQSFLLCRVGLMRVLVWRRSLGIQQALLGIQQAPGGLACCGSPSLADNSGLSHSQPTPNCC